MYRTTSGVLLIYGALLIPAHDVYAASGNPQVAGDRSTVSRNTNGHVSGKKVKVQRVQRLQEKKLASATQAGGLQEIAMHSPVKEMGARETAPQRVEEIADSGSWFAMLIAGLGVALISIRRRIGGLA